jgi:hypothetical protein
MNTTAKILWGGGAALVAFWAVNTPRQLASGAIHHSQPKFKDTTGVPLPLGGFKIRLIMSVSNVSNVGIQLNGATGKVLNYDMDQSGKSYVKDVFGSFVIRDQKTTISPNQTKEFIIEVEPNLGKVFMDVINQGFNIGTYISEQNFRLVGHIFTTLGTFKIDEEITG